MSDRQARAERLLNELQFRLQILETPSIAALRSSGLEAICDALAAEAQAALECSLHRIPKEYCQEEMKRFEQAAREEIDTLKLALSNANQLLGAETDECQQTVMEAKRQAFTAGATAQKESDLEIASGIDNDAHCMDCTDTHKIVEAIRSAPLCQPGDGHAKEP